MVGLLLAWIVYDKLFECIFWTVAGRSLSALLLGLASCEFVLWFKSAQT
jgi:hypothetical protein